MGSSSVYSLFNTDLIVGVDGFDHTTHDGAVETYGDIASESREQLNHYMANGTDIPAIIESHITGVVESGVNIQSTLKDENVVKAFESLIEEHSLPRNFDVEENNHRDEALRQIEHFKTLNGGVLVRYHYNTKWKIPLKQELIGVDMIDTSKTDNKRLKNGLQRDKYNKITHIYLFLDEYKRESKAFSTKHIVYYSQKWMSLSQQTAVSRLVSLLPTLGEMAEYKNSEMRAAIERAKSGVYWDTDLYGTLLQALQEETKRDSKPNSKEIKELLQSLSKRAVTTSGAIPIPKGDRIHEVGKNSDSVYHEFSQQSQKSLASASGGSAVSTYKDLAIGNYASISAIVAHDESGYKVHFDRLKAKIVNDYLERLFTIGVKIGRIPLDLREYEKDEFSYHKWKVLRTSQRNIDSDKTSRANDRNLANNSTTLVNVYAEKKLDYFTEVDKQVDEDIKVAKMMMAKYKEAGAEITLLEALDLISGKKSTQSNREDKKQEME